MCLIADLPARAGDKNDAAAETRLRRAVESLSADGMQGRGLGTKGLDRAAERVAKEFKRLGLKTDLCDGGPYQTFDVCVTSKNRQQQADWLSVLAQIGIRTADDAKKDAPKPDRPKDAAPRRAKIKNVVAALEGRGPRAEETIVIGAHYDHLGEKVDEQGNRVVYNGANDNASGTVAMLEVARILAGRQEKLPRRIVFVAFSGEEQGLLGSLHYVDDPVVQLDKTIAMINLDMVGRLENDQLMTMGTGSSVTMALTARRVCKEHGIELRPIPLSLPCSDHAPFHARGVPVVFFATTGGFGDYHRPVDDADTLDYTGIHRAAQMTADLAVTLAEADGRPEFKDEGVSGALLRGVVRLFGAAAKRMAAEKPEKAKDAARGDKREEPAKDVPRAEKEAKPAESSESRSDESPDRHPVVPSARRVATIRR